MKSRTSWATSPVFEISGERFSDAFRTSTFNGLSAGGISHSPHGLVLYMEPPSFGGANYRNRGRSSHGGRLDGSEETTAQRICPSLPLWKSSTAARSSARVFITNGP